MPQHGDYDLQKQKWYCGGCWMADEEWFSIHDYAPPTTVLQERRLKEDKMKVSPTVTEEEEPTVEEE